MEYMFEGATFKGDISNWDVSNVEYMNSTFKGSRYTPDLSKWNTSKVKSMFRIHQTYQNGIQVK